MIIWSEANRAAEPLICPFCTSGNVKQTPRRSHSAVICECRSCSEPFFVRVDRIAAVVAAAERPANLAA